MPINFRPLHFVFKIGIRKDSIEFYRDVLLMKVLRHEEFGEGCKASCNGPYDGRWSKTMIGYGPEDSHFVLELTYNYGRHKYELGNDFQHIEIWSRDVFANLSKHRGVAELVNAEAEGEGAHFTPHSRIGASCKSAKSQLIRSPDGYRFLIVDAERRDCPAGSPDPICGVKLSVSNLDRSRDYWKSMLGMSELFVDERSCVLAVNDASCQLELEQLSSGDPAVRRAEAFGRIAFSCGLDTDLETLQNLAKSRDFTILTPLVALDTPGKATVKVVIFADPDGHEICVVNEGAFRELSQVDTSAEAVLMEEISKDKS